MGNDAMKLKMSTHLYAASMCGLFHLKSRQGTGFDQQP